MSSSYGPRGGLSLPVQVLERLVHTVQRVILLLEHENEMSRSPRLLTVLPAYVSTTGHTGPSKPVVGKRTLSWADIARG